MNHVNLSIIRNTRQKEKKINALFYSKEKINKERNGIFQYLRECVGQQGIVKAN